MTTASSRTPRPRRSVTCGRSRPGSCSLGSTGCAGTARMRPRPAGASRAVPSRPSRQAARRALRDPRDVSGARPSGGIAGRESARGRWPAALGFGCRREGIAGAHGPRAGLLRARRGLLVRNRGPGCGQPHSEGRACCRLRGCQRPGCPEATRAGANDPAMASAKAACA